MANTATVANPNVSDRHDTSHWVAPIGVNAVSDAPVMLSDLPTADPHIAGALFVLSGVVNISAG